MGRKIRRTRANSLLLGTMPGGCRLCIRGAKLVLFVTGLCDRGCYYCPLSEKRRNRDVVYANERPVRRWRDIVREALEMGALGTGLTGGSPSLKFWRTVGFIRRLKREFGPGHHIHLYCCEDLSTPRLEALRRAGLDEIRFHTWSVEPVERALKIGLDAGVELPAIPGSENRLIEFLEKLDSVGCHFMNLNELEFSETNAAGLLRRGFRLKSDLSMAVRGSEDTARRVLEWASDHVDASLHYCPSSLKDAVQLRNRLLRKAKRIAKPHEEVTEEGLLYKGVVFGIPKARLSSLRRRLIRHYGLPPASVFVNGEKERIELHWKLALWLAELEPGLRFALVEEYPTYDRLETTVTPIERTWRGGVQR